MPDEPATTAPDALGPNAWLVDEMYDRYRADPQSVGESWREFFADYRRGSEDGDGEAGSAGAAPSARGGQAATVAPGAAPAASGSIAAAGQVRSAGQDATVAPMQTSASSASRAAAPPAAGSAAPAGSAAEPLRGAAARIVENMEASLGVPTATSVRPVPAKLLEVNRRIANNHLQRTRGGKVSFTHIIGFALVQALESVPALNNVYTEVDGKPHVVRNEHVNLGLAVDLEKRDGTRTLVVPVIKQADTMDFRRFWEAYEDLIRKVKTNKVTADDFAGATVTLTNPGTIGTVSSVPRLMPGQGAIIGVGALDYPAEYKGADPALLADLGLSKTITLTSTYDHRIIQGAESGLFLKRMEDLLTGADGFYDEMFRAIGVPYEAIEWDRDLNPIDKERVRLQKQVAVSSLINMYRVRGHLIADLDPLRVHPQRQHSELDPVTYGLSIWDLDREWLTDGLAGTETMTLSRIITTLRDAYSRTVGVEYMHIQEPDQKRWIQEHVEGADTQLSRDEQLHILGRLNAAEAFERFLNTKYIGAKRFGIEGAESAIVICDAILDEAARAGMAEVVMGMAHRGRLNVLANIVGKSYKEIFRDFEGDLDPSTVQGSGDVKYHKGYTGKFVGLSGIALPVALAANPSHLEAVDPVVEGIARAKQDELDRGAEYPVLPFLLHGDAAFAGQGVVYETLNLSQLRGYRTGGTVHLVVNNQVGFTTNPDEARSSVYATDVAKAVQAPIFHVNGDDPEACVRVARLAFAFRQAFSKDVVIDMVCYRRLGHNEGDDPRLTQPKMYERIDNRRSVRKLYTEALITRGDLSLDDAERAMDDFSRRLNAALDETRATAPPKFTSVPPRPAERLLPEVVTGVADRGVLDRIAEVVTSAPAGLHLNPKLERVFESRRKLYAGGEVDWALGEAFAFGTLLVEGHDVRIAGQDTGRGTFGHRNAVLVDVDDEHEIVPLNGLAPDQGRFFVYDSSLSEYAALGFEYGYSITAPDSLVAWEAQFGDFANGAQIVIDQFLSSAEDKWGQTSGLVLLLPHGYEGQGPEHSSARIERFLTLCANNNLQVVNVTSAAQLFHVLRRQLARVERKPLVVFTTKSGLRAPWSRSPTEDFLGGTMFQDVLDDPSAGADAGSVRRLILCSGKVAVDAMAGRDARSAPVAVVRVEQLYPWPGEEVAEVLSRYPSATSVVWLQEEPENMGAWHFVRERLAGLVGDGIDLRHVARVASGSPAAGSDALHKLEQADLVERALVEL